MQCKRIRDSIPEQRKRLNIIHDFKIFILICLNYHQADTDLFRNIQTWNFCGALLSDHYSVLMLQSKV